MYELENELFKKILAPLKEENLSFAFSYENYRELLDQRASISSDLFTKEHKQLYDYLTLLYDYLYASNFKSIEHLAQLPTLTLTEANNLLAWFRKLFFSEIAESIFLSELSFDLFEKHHKNIFIFLEEHDLINRFDKNKFFFFPLLFAAFSISNIALNTIVLFILSPAYESDTSIISQDFRVYLTRYALSSENNLILSFSFWKHLYSMSAHSTAVDWQTLLIYTPENSNIDYKVRQQGNLVLKNILRKNIQDCLKEELPSHEENITTLINFLSNRFCITEPEPAFLDQLITLADFFDSVATDFELFLDSTALDRLKDLAANLREERELQESLRERNEDETTPEEIPVAVEPLRQQESKRSKPSMFAHANRQTQTYPSPHR